MIKQGGISIPEAPNTTRVTAVAVRAGNTVVYVGGRWAWI
jgi:hypothetical protein